MKKLNLILIFLSVFVNISVAQLEGILDDTFDGDGKVITDFGLGSSRINAVAIQPDGKIVAAGLVMMLPILDFALTRYNMDGSLDATFGTNGKVITDLGSNWDQIYSIAIQSDGKIVAAGLVDNGVNWDFTLARYNSDGSLDGGFGTNGIVATDFGGSEELAYSMAIQPDGKIVTAGYAVNLSNISFALTRHNSDGTPDISFDTDGKLTTSFDQGYSIGYSVALQPDNKIIIAGSSVGSFALARYNPDGSLDNSFGTNGKVFSSSGGNGEDGRSVAIQSDGKIIVAGSSYPYNGSASMILRRYNANGELDNSFDQDGRLITDFGTGDALAYSVTIQPDGKIVIAGSADDGFALARYHPDGTLDNSFNIDGKLITHFSQSAVANAIVMQADGKIVAGGSFYNGLDFDFAMARYISGLNVGIIDFSISDNSILIYPNPIDHYATLEYTLQNEESISIELVDLQGRILKSFLTNQKQQEGNHQQEIILPHELPSGYYLIVLSSPDGKISVQIVK